MFNNPGRKLKIVAIIAFFLVILAGLGLGVAVILIRNDFYGIFIGVGFIIFSIVLAWLGALLIYSFGQLVQSTQNSEKTLKQIDNRLKVIENKSIKGEEKITENEEKITEKE